MATKTYVKKSIRGNYIEFPHEIDQEYWAGQTGQTYDDYLADLWVLLSTAQVKFHNDHPEASVREVIAMSLDPVPGRTLEQAKTERIQAITNYDASDSVNSFIVKLTPDTEEGGETIEGETITDWFTAAERANHKNTVDAAEITGLATLNVPLGGQTVEIPTSFAKVALAQIQLYADRCYIVTETHKANVNALETVEAVDNYDFSAGYPERLVFKLYEE